MIIEKIEIESFGKFKDFTLSFEKGINVLYGENEAGKSTIAAFLYAMFYDFPSSRGKALRDDLRKKYTPWSGEAMAGSVYFSHEGKSYVLKRRMAKTAKSAKVSLFDAETWEEIEDERKEAPGEYFFKIGADGFLKTIFISQLGAPVEKGKNDEIIERLSNLKQSGDEDISYQKTVATLEKKLYSLISASGSKGEITQLTKENEELKKKLEETAEIERLYKQAIIKRTEEEKNKEQLLKTKEQLTSSKVTAQSHKAFLAASAARDRLKLLEEEKSKKLEELKKSDEKLSATIERTEELKYTDSIDENMPDLLSEMAAKNAVFEQRLNEIRKRREKASQLKEELSQLEGKKKTRINPVLLSLALILLVVGAVLGLVVMPWCAAATIPAIVLLILLFKPSAAFKEAEKKAAELAAELDRINPDLSEENEILRAQHENRAKEEEILKSAHSHSAAELLKKLSERETISELLNAAQTENSIIRESVNKLEKELLQLQVDADMSQFSDEVKSYSGKNEDEISEELMQIQNELIMCEKRLTEAETMLSSLSPSDKTSAQILTEIGINEEKAEELSRVYRATEKALMLVRESYEDLKSDFAPLLSGKVREAALYLTDGKYTDVRVSDDYELKVQSKNEIIDVGYLSGGTYDLLYLALRLGILKVLFGDRLPILIFDDAFLQFDDVRTKRAADYIKKEACEQVIYFTCHGGQKEIFGSKDVNIIDF